MSDTDMTDNPYAQGEGTNTGPSMTPSGDGMSPGSFFIGDTLKLVFETFRKFWLMGGVACLVFIIMAIVAVFAAAIPGAVLAEVTEDSLMITIISQLISQPLSVVLQAPVNFGAVWLAYVSVRMYVEKGEFRFDALFRGFTSFGTIVVIALIRWLVTVAAALPGLMIVAAVFVLTMGGKIDANAFKELAKNPSNFAIIVILGIILTGVPLIYVALRLFLAEFIAVEHKQSPVDALKSSWQLTNGNVLKILGLYFVWFLLLMLLSPFLGLGVVLTCGLGILPAGFLGLLPGGALYYQLTQHIPRPKLA